MEVIIRVSEVRIFDAIGMGNPRYVVICLLPNSLIANQTISSRHLVPLF